MAHHFGGACAYKALRIGGWAQILLALPSFDSPFCVVECTNQSAAIAKLLIEKSIAKERPIPLRLTTKRRAIWRRGCQQDRVVVHQGRYKGAREACGYDHHAIADIGGVQHVSQVIGAQRSAQSVVFTYDRGSVGLTVCGNEQHDQIFVGVGERSNLANRSSEIVWRGGWIAALALATRAQRYGTALSAKVLSKDLLRLRGLALKHRIAPKRSGNEVDVLLTRALRLKRL